MAMNFKIFNDDELLSIYTGDILRKQVHNNPESILALELNKDLDWTYEKFAGEVTQHPADFSQVYIATVNSNGDADIFNHLDIPKNQLKTRGTSEQLSSILGGKKQVNLALLNIGANGGVGYSGSGDDELLFAARELILVAAGEDKAKAVRDLYDAAENGSEAFSKVKQHRMVTVVLDSAAASRLDPDIAEYYTSEFA
ncbi:6-phosphogluconolactonase [Salinicoccus albus]|uniref:6-phosphogluconolactonase n=1 Tax=Salinicoccus albus TaxID=418756 RepID=UPI000375BAE1|nr:hypothetical protein [Salinicoccus albus]